MRGRDRDTPRRSFRCRTVPGAEEFCPLLPGDDARSHLGGSPPCHENLAPALRFEDAFDNTARRKFPLFVVWIIVLGGTDSVQALTELDSLGRANDGRPLVE